MGCITGVQNPRRCSKKRSGGAETGLREAVERSPPGRRNDAEAARRILSFRWLHGARRRNCTSRRDRRRHRPPEVGGLDFRPSRCFSGSGTNQPVLRDRAGVRRFCSLTGIESQERRNPSLPRSSGRLFGGGILPVPNHWRRSRLRSDHCSGRQARDFWVSSAGALRRGMRVALIDKRRDDFVCV